MAQANFLCGCIIDETNEFYLKDLNCTDDIETTVYSKFGDQVGCEIPCHCCGSPLSKEVLKKYVESKKTHITVYPTCTVAKCAKNKTHKWRDLKKRALNKVNENEEKLKKKIKLLLKRRRDAESDDA